MFLFFGTEWVFVGGLLWACVLLCVCVVGLCVGVCVLCVCVCVGGVCVCVLLVCVCVWGGGVGGGGCGLTG